MERETVLPRLYRLGLTFSVALVLLLAAVVALAEGPSPRPAADAAPTSASLDRLLPIEPDLLKAALQNPDQPADFIVYLRDKADLTAAEREPSKAARGTAVVAALKATADQSQAGVRAALDKAQQAGKVSRVQPFWVTNAIAVRGAADVILTLAARPDVAIIRANREWTLPVRPTAAAAATTVEWNIQALRADGVWNLMGIDGQGTVVASMDTGVDGQHPDLMTAYRGYTGGLPDHRSNWYCATDEGYLYPGDGVGHGTHTTGLMVGRNGVGVAPGAKWIAVKVFDDRARTTDAWIHDAFQWLLAPGGDPTRAPDVVNGSWSSGAYDSLIYRDDIRALRAAGIIPVFSAGNDGPFNASINIPGGYAEVLTVGATDSESHLASFSSRGPSAFAPFKPDVVAPGVGIRSAWHGGGYRLLDGTSMATPQVSGIAALMRQANPRLTPQQVIDLVRATARPIGDTPTPNNQVGAGLADAYAAVAMALDAGEMAGRVSRDGDGGGVAGADVAATSFANGATIRVQTDATGAYTLPLSAGTYTVAIRAFGYTSFEQRGVVIDADRRTTLNATLSLLPAGVILVRVVDSQGAPLAARIIVEDTPMTVTAQASTGIYSLALPPGDYQLRVEMRGHRIGRARVSVPTAGVAVSQDFTLTDAPTILLVDGGAWYYAGAVSYYQAALDARDYLYDLHAVRSVYDDTPTLARLRDYDIVIWSSAKDSPRYVGADETLANYLRQGGRLIISGQDIAYWDGGGAGSFVAEYFRGFLNARFVADQANAHSVTGAGPLAGLTWTLDGPDSANNQAAPDVIGPVKPEASQTIALYPSSRGAGLLVNRCAPHRSLYLSFGIEGVNGLSDRATLLDTAIRLMTDSAPDHALAARVNREQEVGAAGEVLTYTVTLRNLGAQADQYSLTIEGAQWPTQIIDPASGAPVTTLDVPACGTRDLVVRVSIPAGEGWNAHDTATLRIVSRDGGSGPVSQLLRIESHTPAPLLVVDDDQWVDVQASYTQALTTAGIPYDLWEVGHSTNDGRGSPPTERLAMYPVVLWFTGYDFLDTLSPAEEARLAAYLAAGGRLLLSAQDYLYTAGLNRFGVDYLGVLTFTEDLTTDSLTGVRGDPVGDGLGPYPLDFERVFRSSRYNHSDALAPTAYATPTFLGGHGRSVGLRLDAGGFRTAFFAVPLETLPTDALPLVLAHSIGWLQPLGASSLTANSDIVASGSELTYTVRLINRGPLPRAAVEFSGAPPTHTGLLADSLDGATLVDGRLTWSGPLPAGGTHTIRYRVTVDEGLPPGTLLPGQGLIRDETGLTSEVRHLARANVPDLAPTFIVADKAKVEAGDLVTFVAAPRNQGALDAAAVMTITLPSGLGLLPDSLFVTSGTAHTTPNEVVWRGAVARTGPPTTLTFQARVAADYRGGPLTTLARIEDGFGVVVERGAVIGRDWQVFLPLVLRRASP